MNDISFEDFSDSTLPTPGAYSNFVNEFIENFDNNNRVSEAAIQYSIEHPFNETRENPIYTYTKVSLINDNYSTHLSSTEKIAISRILFDYFEGIQNQNYNENLIENIRTACKEDADLHKDPYSFITKYCCHHNPNSYPIYDSYVDIMLRWYSFLPAFQFNLADVNSDFNDYNSFRNALYDIKTVFEADESIDSITYRDLDKFLWSAGKRFFNPYVDKDWYNNNYKNRPELY